MTISTKRCGLRRPECDQHQPDVIVGSSRGGAVAMNIDSGDTPLVLLCPAWKKWGSATTINSNTTILHSRADDTVPFEDSEELLRNTDLPPYLLVETGNDHRLVDAESLRRMLDACDEALIKQLWRYVSRLRIAIDRTKEGHPDQDELPFINRWPTNCCDAPYLFFLLYERGHRRLVRKCGDVSYYGENFEKHVWIVFDGITIDISADQFPDVNETVIIARDSPWHDGLRIIEERPWAIDDEEELYGRYLKTNSYYAYEKILPLYAPLPESV